MSTSYDLAQYLDNPTFTGANDEYCYLCKKSIDECKHSMFDEL